MSQLETLLPSLKVTESTKRILLDEFGPWTKPWPISCKVQGPNVGLVFPGKLRLAYAAHQTQHISTCWFLVWKVSWCFCHGTSWHQGSREDLRLFRMSRATRHCSISFTLSLSLGINLGLVLVARRIGVMCGPEKRATELRSHLGFFCASWAL